MYNYINSASVYNYIYIYIGILLCITSDLQKKFFYIYIHFIQVFIVYDLPLQI